MNFKISSWSSHFHIEHFAACKQYCFMIFWWCYKAFISMYCYFTWWLSSRATCICTCMCIQYPIPTVCEYSAMLFWCHLLEAFMLVSLPFSLLFLFVCVSLSFQDATSNLGVTALTLHLPFVGFTYSHGSLLSDIPPQQQPTGSFPQLERENETGIIRHPQPGVCVCVCVYAPSVCFTCKPCVCGCQKL